VGIKTSSASGSFEYKVEPAILAQVCQDVLGNVGKVKTVSRETGTIVGYVGNWWLGAAEAVLQIKKKDDSSTLTIQLTRDEGLATWGGAQKALETFTKALGEDKRLAGKSAGGW
jgi:hypothetical protein